MEINFDIYKLETPYIIVDEARLIRNLEILKGVIDRTGCKILLAQKAFDVFALSENPSVSARDDGERAL